METGEHSPHSPATPPRKQRRRSSTHLCEELLVACKDGNLDEARRLVLVEETDPLKVDRTDPSILLMVASLAGHTPIVEFLVQEANLNPTTHGKQGFTPLHMCCQTGKTETVEYLLRHASDSRSLRTMTEAVDDNGCTPLLIACRDGHVETVRMLARLANADIEARQAHGFTPLHASCGHGHLDVVRELVALGANINATTDRGWDALRLASYYGFFDIVRYLVGFANAPISRKCIKAATAQGHTNVADWLTQARSWTTLHLACDVGHFQLVLQLLRDGADPTVCDERGRTPHSLATGPPPPWRTELACVPCPQTSQILHAALSPWTPQTHFLFPPDFRRGVFTLLLVERRLRSEASNPVPRLPVELWFVIAFHLPRK